MARSKLSQRQKEAVSIYLSDFSRQFGLLLIVSYFLLCIFSEEDMSSLGLIFGFLGLGGLLVCVGGYIRVKYASDDTP